MLLMVQLVWGSVFFILDRIVVAELTAFAVIMRKFINIIVKEDYCDDPKTCCNFADLTFFST